MFNNILGDSGDNLLFFFLLLVVLFCFCGDDGLLGGVGGFGDDSSLLFFFLLLVVLFCSCGDRLGGIGGRDC
ncbi:hypothetical protein [Sedimentibacter sp.]|uniref:hypothetical protein n=1 Tax=Sedimentibacter sp. TaxID=1960295 RepID=UPI0028A14200|nr:hypothetical protein [Sedimentibacter sp.]